MIRHCSRLTLIAFLLAGLAGCDKDKPKVEDKKPESTPVPSGLVFNDFPMPGSGAGLGVRDAGLEGGLAAVGAGEPGDQGPGDAAAGKLAVKLVEPGAEPRAVRKYTFVPNKVDKRVLTMTQSVTQSAGGQTSPPQEMTLKISLDVATKQVKPSGATLELKVTKVELPGAPPQVGQMLAAMNGLSGTFEVSPNGEAGEVQFAGTPQMQNQLAQTMLSGLSRAAELLVAPLPTAPIGVGAKWELSMKSGEGEQGAKRFTLKEVSNEGGVVESEIELKVPRRAQQSQRGGTAFVEVDGKGKHTQTVRWNQVVQKSDGDLTVTQKIEASDPRGGGKQTGVVTEKSHDTIETPGAPVAPK